MQYTIFILVIQMNNVFLQINILKYVFINFIKELLSFNKNVN